MLIRPISNNQQSFKAVNQKYFAWAKEDIRRGGDVSTEWIQRLRFDVFLFNKINRKDAIDTVEEVKKYLGKTDDVFEHILENFRNPNP